MARSPAQRGDFGEDAYQSGSTWLIDTNGERFRQWLAAHATTPRVKGRLLRDELRQGGEEQAHACVLDPPTHPQDGDILAVQLFDGSEALVQVRGPSVLMGGTSEDFLRVTVLKPTGPYGKLWYITHTKDRSTPYEYDLPAFSDTIYGRDLPNPPLNTYRILMWEEL